jgi:hypothetical protein
MVLRHGIADLAGAKAYLADAVLGPRLAEITAAVAKQLQAGVTLTALLGDLDARRAVSSLTLFERAASGTPGGEPWIGSILASAVTVLAKAEAQGLPRCSLTVARLEVGRGW